MTKSEKDKFIKIIKKGDLELKDQCYINILLFDSILLYHKLKLVKL